MRQVTVREMRALLPEIEQALRTEGELVLTKRGRPVARLMPIPDRTPASLSTRELRARMTPSIVPSEVLIRQDRDER